MNDLLQLVQERMRTFCNIERFVVAYSGGMDSHVLLHILASIQDKLPGKIVAWHINHGLQEQAMQFQQACEGVCRSLDIEFEVFALDISKSVIAKKGMEAAARASRYQVFKRELRASDLLLLAHHQDDQVETFFLRLLRGSGVRGLSAMPQERILGKGKLHRPLLSATRDSIEQYARKYHLEWVDDLTNQDIAIDRNYLRHEIIPRLKHKWPGVATRVTTSAAICTATDGELQQQMLDILPIYLQGKQLSVRQLNDLSPVKISYLIRVWLESLDLPLPSYKQMHNLLDQLTQLRTDSNLLVEWSGVALRHFNGYLYANVTQLPLDNNLYSWDLQVKLLLENGEYRAQQVVGCGLQLNGSVTVCFRPQAPSSGETIKKVMQAKAIPPWQRDAVPLVFVDKQLIAIADMWVRHSCCVKDESQQGWYLTWEPVVNSDLLR
jgi:tRNA(Ile)-lysidine synthase